MSPPAETYRVYAIKYAHHQRRSTANFIGGDTHDVPMPLDYFVWAGVGQSKTWLVDTRFDQAGAEKRGRPITTPIPKRGGAPRRAGRSGGDGGLTHPPHHH